MATLAIKVKLTIHHVVVFDTPCKAEYLLKNSAIPFHVCERKLYYGQEDSYAFLNEPCFWKSTAEVTSLQALSFSSFFHAHGMIVPLPFFFPFYHDFVRITEVPTHAFFEFFYSFLIIVLQLVPIINLSSISVFRFFFFFGCVFYFLKNL